nr:MAG TPA: sulfotransferase [Bacteriophage sp.]
MLRKRLCIRIFFIISSGKSSPTFFCDFLISHI